MCLQWCRCNIPTPVKVHQAISIFLQSYGNGNYCLSAVIHLSFTALLKTNSQNFCIVPVSNVGCMYLNLFTNIAVDSICYLVPIDQEMTLPYDYML